MSKISSLGDIVSFIGGGTPDRKKEEYWGGEIPWATVKDFNSGNLLKKPQESITQIGLKSSASNLIKAGTLVIPTRMALGKAAIASVDMAINQDLKAVIPNTNIDTRYLLWYFIANSKKIDEMGKGATVKGVTLDQLRQLKINVPALEEQRRIAAILDKAEALRAKRREAITKLDQLLQSVFLEMFGDPASNPKNLPETSIIKEAEISSGSTPSRSNDENFSGKFPWVKSTEVDWGFIKSTSEHVSDSGIKSARLKTFPPNTVVVALYGQGVTRGKCAILNIAATMNQACAGIKPCATLKHEFLFQFLKMSYQRLRDQARGGNQENLNVGILGEFKIFKPDLKLQEDFSKIFHRVEFLKDKELKSLEELEKLIVSFQVNFF